MSVCEFVMLADTSSIRSSNPAKLLGVAVEMLAVVAWLVTSQILSARWEVESRLPSVWPTKSPALVGADVWSRLCG